MVELLAIQACCMCYSSSPVLSGSAANPGHHTDCLAMSQHLVMTWCPVWMERKERLMICFDVESQTNVVGGETFAGPGERECFFLYLSVTLLGGRHRT